MTSALDRIDGNGFMVDNHSFFTPVGGTFWTDGSEESGEPDFNQYHTALMVHVTPAFAFAPARVRALVKIREDSRNRRLHVVIDSGGHYQSSDIQLDGADARKIQEVFWKALPSGNYTLVAVVYRAAGPSSRVELRFKVLAGLQG